MMKKRLTELGGDFSMAGTLQANSAGNLRTDPVRGSRGSLVNDAAVDASTSRQDVESMPKAVVTFLKQDGKVLAVSRGADATNLNMPGGLVNPGEDPQEAAVRELWEETGIIADEIFPIFGRINGGYFVTAYKVPTFHGKLKGSKEGTPSWEKPSVLKGSAYGDYFKEMLAHLHDEALAESRRSR